MNRTITARLSRPISEPELSRVWEANANLYEGPEVLFHVNGTEVEIEYPAQREERGTEGLQRAFEGALRQFDPGLRVEWTAAV
ncbi:MAG: hypothetical protein SFV54_20330 [Bryobacteraceae bacterium]|nr:hypothetical protein [Bryobacteraceae bacterium]